MILAEQQQLELATRSIHGVLALVNELVAGVDGVKGRPVAGGDSDDLAETGREVFAVEDAGEDADMAL